MTNQIIAFEIIFFLRVATTIAQLRFYHLTVEAKFHYRLKFQVKENFHGARGKLEVKFVKSKKSFQVQGSSHTNAQALSTKVIYRYFCVWKNIKQINQQKKKRK